jgi:hypothetical protein
LTALQCNERAEVPGLGVSAGVRRGTGGLQTVIDLETILGGHTPSGSPGASRIYKLKSIVIWTCPLSEVYLIYTFRKLAVVVIEAGVG